MAIMKAAKQWFSAHPRTKLIYHWRKDAMPLASRENMFLPRDTTVVGNRVLFGPHRSEMSLSDQDGWTSRITEGGLLDILNTEGRIMMTYGAAD